MRNRLASLIVVKQEPNSNSIGSNQTNLGSQSAAYTGVVGITEIHNNNNNQQHNLYNNNEVIQSGDLTHTSTTINIKTENHFYEINNNNLHHSDNYNYNTNNNLTNNTNGGGKNLPPSPITASTTPTNFIYPCRNLFPDGCDISHHHSQQHHPQLQQHHHSTQLNTNNNCSNYYYNLSETPSPVTPPYGTANGDKFILKSEPLPYEHSVLDVVAAAATATDNLWCLSNLTYRKQLGSFHVATTSSSPEHHFQHNNSSNNSNSSN
ncbi:GATA zinc finger domain-containing protein 15-like, partial [Musca vetustissima]|uniref:GATA zinc finger domain-containing protein 15-like n=1 Tax=Musca vetustissima TaxID=27455 RepID=UPI002AB63E60